MGREQLQLEKVVQSMREPIRQYADLMRELAGDNAKTLTLFGAIAAGTFDAARHTVRNVLLMDKVDLAVLRRIAENGAKLGKARISAPLIMTTKYIKASLDTFPLELIEIQQMHLTVFGDDPFEGLTFDVEHVRLQCEREFKSMLIGLRQGLLAAAGRDKVLGAVELDVGEGLLRAMRGTLWAKGIKEAKNSSEVVTEMEKITGKKLPGIRTALDVTGHHGWEQFEGLYNDVEALAEAADA